MRFGITPLELANIISLVSEGGQVDFRRFSFEHIIRVTRERGFSLMEVTMDVGFVLPGGLTERTVMALKALKDELGLTYTAHLPLWAIEPACPNEIIREASLECLVKAVERVRPLEPEVLVLHATGALAAEFSRLDVSPFIKNIITDQFASFAEQSVRELLERTKLPSRKIALENIEFPFEATWRIAERLDTSICFDTGHLLAGYSGPIDVLDFVKRYYSRIREIHLHDGGHNPVGEDVVRRFDHQTLGTGALPIEALLTELHRRRYKGAIIFELRQSQALESLEVIRRRLPDLPID
jgi:sugar phosphate isomerase/epimerase